MNQRESVLSLAQWELNCQLVLLDVVALSLLQGQPLVKSGYNRDSCWRCGGTGCCSLPLSLCVLSLLPSKKKKTSSTFESETSIYSWSFDLSCDFVMQSFIPMTEVKEQFPSLDNKDLTVNKVPVHLCVVMNMHPCIHTHTLGQARRHQQWYEEPRTSCFTRAAHCTSSCYHGRGRGHKSPARDGPHKSHHSSTHFLRITEV